MSAVAIIATESKFVESWQSFVRTTKSDDIHVHIPVTTSRVGGRKFVTEIEASSWLDRRELEFWDAYAQLFLLHTSEGRSSRRNGLFSLKPFFKTGGQLFSLMSKGWERTLGELYWSTLHPKPLWNTINFKTWKFEQVLTFAVNSRNFLNGIKFVKCYQ